MLHYLLAVSSPPVTTLFMLDNALADGKIHGNLGGINAPGGKSTGRKYNFPHLLNKFGYLFGGYTRLFWHCGNVRYSGWFAKLAVVKNCAFLLTGRAEGACPFPFLLLRFLDGQTENSPYRLASFFFLSYFLSLGFMRDTYRPTMRHLFLTATVWQVAGSLHRHRRGGKCDFAGSGQTQNLGKSHKDRRTNFVMRICRGCSRLAIRVPRLFVVGIRLDRDRQSYISRKPCSSAVFLRRAFPDLRENVAA